MEREELIALLSAQDGEYRKSGDSAGKYENYGAPGYSAYSPGGAQSNSGGTGGGGLLSLLCAGLSALGSSMMDDAMAQEAAQSVPESSYQQAYEQAVDKLESARQTSDVLPEVQADKLPGRATGGVDKIYSDRIDVTKEYPEVQEWIQMGGSGADKLPSVQPDKIESRARSGEVWQDRIDPTKDYPEVQKYEEKPEIRTVSQDAVRREAQKWNADNGLQSTDYKPQSANRSLWDTVSDYAGKAFDALTKQAQSHNTASGLAADLGAWALAGPVIAAAPAASAAAVAAPATASNVISLSAYKAASAVAGAGAVASNLASAAAQGNGAVSGSQINSWNPQTKTYSSGTTLNTLKQAAVTSAIKAQTTQSKLNTAITSSKSQPVQSKQLTGGGTGSW